LTSISKELSAGEAPLLELKNFEFKGGGLLVFPPRIETSQNRLICLGAAGQIVPALVNKELSRWGSILLRGALPTRAFMEGRAGYAPQRLTLPPQIRLIDALILSAQLIGLAKPHAEDALRRTGLLKVKKKRLGQLTRGEQSLSGLASALCSNPQIVVAEDLFHNLNPEEATRLQEVWDTEVEQKAWILALVPRTPSAYAMLKQEVEVIVDLDGTIQQPRSSQNLPGRAFWVRSSQNIEPLAALLLKHNVPNTPSPEKTVLLIENCSEGKICAFAEEIDLPLLQVSPCISAARPPSHARRRA